MKLAELESQLKKKCLKELKEIKLLVDTYYQKKSKCKIQNLVDTYINKSGIYFRLERVFCNKPNCNKCNGKDKKGHGPYWYSYKNGKRKYVGKKTKEQLNDVKPFSKLKSNNKTQLPYKR